MLGLTEPQFSLHTKLPFCAHLLKLRPCSQTKMALLFRTPPSSRSLLKVLLGGVSLLVVYIFYELYVGFKSNKLFKFESTARQGKIIFVFEWYEHLTMASNNLIRLTALAAYKGRQVVVPFVKNSYFTGTAASEKTLALYYNLTTLNNTLRSHGHGTLISWEGFQDVCRGRLDVLVYFDYSNLKATTNYSLATPFFPCSDRHEHTFRGFKVGTTICMNVFALNSVQRFENEVLKGLPCVGIFKWKGTGDSIHSVRAQFDIESVVGNVLSFYNMSVSFSSKLLQIAKDFVAKNLGPFFLSAHIRTGKMLVKGKNLSDIKECISNLKTHVQSIMIARKQRFAPIPVFLASDFAQFGSGSSRVKSVRKHAKSLMEILLPLKPIIFQPSEFQLADRGAVAIVEMNILASAKRLVVIGGGSFQSWVISQFRNKNTNDRRTKVDRLAC